MTLSALASVAFLAVVVPHIGSAPAAAVAAPALQTGAPTQTLERLQFRGVSSPAAPLATALTDTATDNTRPRAREIKLRSVHPGRNGAAALATAPIGIPAPPGQSVVGADAGFVGFPGLTHRDQHNAGTGVYAHSQFSLEPPDQGLCVGNGYVMETVNNAFTVYDSRGARLTAPTAASQFFHLAPEFNPNSQPTTFGPLVSDPRCYFDVATQRWFITELEADAALLSGALTGPTAVFVAVSQTANPTGAYSLYAIDTTDAGPAGKPNCPCLPDQPLFGADANGVYISTNEFPLFVPGFNGAQIYALSKRALAAGILPTVVHIDAGAIPVGTPNAGPWYSIQPATSPDPSQESSSRNGTEFFLSALDFSATVPNDNRVAVWALSNTASLRNLKPNVKLQHVVIPSVAYAAPPAAVQKPGPTPLGTSLGEPLPLLNSNDDRMNQVVYAGGRLWSGLNTAVSFGTAEPNVGIAYFVVAPQLASSGSLSAHMTAGGYVAVRGENVMFPSIGVNSRGVPVMAFTLVGPQYFPSAAYVTENAGHVSNVKLAGPGAAPDDGFTAYKAYGGNGIARWGDYSAAVADRDGSIWFATEYIPNAPRTALANWGTFIGHVPTH